MGNENSKRKRLLELASTLEKENKRLVLSKNMLRIVISDSARDAIVECLRTVAGGHANCTCSPLTNYTDSPHEPPCPLASEQLRGES